VLSGGIIYAIYININHLMTVEFRIELVFGSIGAALVGILPWAIILYASYRKGGSRLVTTGKKFKPSIRTVYTKHQEPWETELEQWTPVEKSAKTGYIPREVKREVWRRDMGRCVECGSNERLEYDHIIPVRNGGSNTVRNVQLLCEKCNRKKSNLI